MLASGIQKRAIFAQKTILRIKIVQNISANSLSR